MHLLVSNGPSPPPGPPAASEGTEGTIRAVTVTRGPSVRRPRPGLKTARTRRATGRVQFNAHCQPVDRVTVLPWQAADIKLLEQKLV